MEFKPVKTRKERQKEEGLPINFVEVTIIVSASKAKKAQKYEKKVEVVYKKKKADDNADEFFMHRVREYAKLDKKAIFRIKNIRIIKSMGMGSYEE